MRLWRDARTDHRCLRCSPPIGSVTSSAPTAHLLPLIKRYELPQSVDEFDRQSTPNISVERTRVVFESVNVLCVRRFCKDGQCFL